MVEGKVCKGRRNEARALRDENFTKNTATVQGRDKDGNIVKTIPDAITRTQVIEIKDVKTLYNTRQIQAQANYAKNGRVPREYVVFVGTNTHVTKPALDTIQNAGGRIERKSYLGLGD